jgi:hypothetical protein
VFNNWKIKKESTHATTTLFAPDKIIAAFMNESSLAVLTYQQLK